MNEKLNTVDVDKALPTIPNKSKGFSSVSKATPAVGIATVICQPSASMTYDQVQPKVQHANMQKVS